MFLPVFSVVALHVIKLCNHKKTRTVRDLWFLLKKLTVTYRKSENGNCRGTNEPFKFCSVYDICGSFVCVCVYFSCWTTSARSGTRWLWWTTAAEWRLVSSTIGRFTGSRNSVVVTAGASVAGRLYTYPSGCTLPSGCWEDG